MGLFSKKQVIGEFVLYHYQNRELVFSNTLNPGMTNLGFALFLGKLVYDLGPELGTQLWQEIFHLASDAFENVVRAESSTPLESRRFEADKPFLVVSSSNEIDPLKETVNVVQKGDQFFCQTSTSPMGYLNTESIVMEGCETLFVHLFNSGEKETKFFLPVVVMAQCNWYQDNGHPSISQINTAAYAGISAEYQIASQMQ